MKFRILMTRKLPVLALCIFILTGNSQQVFAAEEFLRPETGEEELLLQEDQESLEEAEEEVTRLEEDAESSKGEKTLPGEDTNSSVEEETLLEEGAEYSEENELLLEEEEIPSEDLGQEALEDEKDSLLTMPKEYAITKEDIELKEELAENDVLSDFDDLVEGRDYVADEVICMAETYDEALAIAAAYGGELRDFSYKVATISLENSELSVAEAFEAGINTEVEVPAVEPNYIMQFEEDVEFNDPFLSPSSGSYQWQHEMVGSSIAWEKAVGSSDVIVAVIDSGVRTTHEDLADSIVDNLDEINQATAAAGMNTDNEDNNSHGTHVAGIIAATAGNGKGGAGIAPGVKILPLKVNTPQNPGSVRTDYMIKAVQYVAGANNTDDGYVYTKRRADIINMSIGSYIYNASLNSAIEAAYNQGVTIVAAMGNAGTNVKSYPAAYDHVIAVCNIDEDGNRYSNSNYGSWADISAPGAHIYSAVNSSDSSYGMKTGTSMAGPMVAGACALYMSYAGHTDPDTMESILKKSAINTGNSNMGAGILDVAKMLGMSNKKSYTVKTMTLDKGMLVLERNALGSVGSSTLKVKSLVDTKNSNLLIGEKYKKVALSWTSSNKNVVDIKVVTSDTEPDYVELIPVAAGTATVTCKAMDGARKTASCTVAVSGDAIIDSVRLTSDISGNNVAVNNDSISSVALYRGVNADYVAEEGNERFDEITVTAVQSTDSLLEDLELNDPVWKNSAPKVVSLTTNGKSAVIKALAPGKATITCAASDGSGKKATATVTVKQFVTSVGVTGQAYIAPGAKATYKATAYPANAGSRAVKWEVGAPASDGDLLSIEGISISTKGVLQVKKNVSYDGEIQVRAVAKDQMTVMGVKSVYISNKAKNVSISAPYGKVMGTIERGNLSTSLELVGTTDKGTRVSFSSSNKKIAVVESTTYDQETGKTTCTLKALKKGTVTITCKALDGSGKKKTVKIKVRKPVDKITVTGRKNAVIGTTTTFKANALAKTASVKSVRWSAGVLEGDGRISAVDGVSISGGKLKVRSGIGDISEITVRATAGDGSLVYGEKTVNIRERKAKNIQISAASDDSFYGFRKKNGVYNIKLFTRNIPSGSGSSDALNENKLKLESTIVYAGSETESGEGYTTWSSSNSKVASVSSDGTVMGISKGTATITCKASDGSDKSARIKVTVLTPASGLIMQTKNLSGDKLAYGGTVTYAAYLRNNYGTPSTTKLKWSFEIIGITDTGQEDYLSAEYPSFYKILRKNNCFFTFKDGKVTVNSKANYTKYLNKYGNGDYGSGAYKSFTYSVTCETTDGTGFSRTAGGAEIVDAATGAEFTSYDRTETQVNAETTVLYSKASAATTNITIDLANENTTLYSKFLPAYAVNVGVDKKDTDFIVSSENPDIIGTYRSSVPTAGSSENAYLIRPYKVGTARVVVTMLDGSGKKFYLNVRVVDNSEILLP